jgi:chromosome segregation ATPase
MRTTTFRNVWNTLVLCSLVFLIAFCVLQHRNHVQLTRLNAELQNRIDSLEQENREADARVKQLKVEYDEKEKRLADVGSRLSALNKELLRLRNARQPITNGSPELRARSTDPKAEPQSPPITEQQISTFLASKPSEQGQLLGQLRRKTMSGEANSRTNHLARAVRDKLEDLEATPKAFAEFQSSFVKEAIGLDDDQKVSQLAQIIEKTYEHAVANGLDSSHRPQDEAEQWALRRDALDRRATQMVQDLLSPEERQRFDTAFLGIMGIDLGLGNNDGARHRFVTADGAVVFPSQNP